MADKPPVLMTAFKRAIVSAVVFVCAAMLPTDASARVACDFEVEGAVYLPDAAVVRTLRCLVVELARLKRENAALKRRLAEVEGLLTELPAAYSNVDGVVTEELGRAIGTATFVLSARSTGGANALPIEQRVLDEVCGVSGGCAVSVVFRQIGLFNDEPKDSVLTGPCQFTYAPDDGDWTLGSGCGSGPISGTDGDRLSGEAAAADPVIVSSGGACIFSESAPSRSVGTENGFQRDTAPGLFLVAMPSRQPDGIRRFQCELVLN